MSCFLADFLAGTWAPEVPEFGCFDCSHSAHASCEIQAHPMAQSAAGRFFTSVVTEPSYIERFMQTGSQRYMAQENRGNPVATYPSCPFFPYNTSTF